MIRTFGLITVLSIVFLTGCAENPVTGESQFSFISPAQEVEIGKKNYGPYQQQQGGRYIVDPDLSLYVNQIGQKLAKVSDRPGLPYEFVVLNNDVPNAWALPGGKIAVNRGLLWMLEDEAQLAAVLSHEIVHAAAKHGATQMTQATLLGIGVSAVGMASQKSEYGQLISMGAGLGAGLYQARYGRQQELDSDFYGINYMVKAGYDPQAAVELQEKFVELSKGQQSNWMSELFASHPPSQERVDRNRQKAQALGKGVRNKEVYQTAIKQIRKDRAAYDLNQKARKALADNNINSALALTHQAIKMQGNEALFHITRGQAHMAQKQFDNSTKNFSKAVALNPEYFLGYLGLGMSQLEQKSNVKAKSNLERSTQLLPTTIAAFHLGELELAAGNRDKAIGYFQFAAQDQGQIGQAAKQQLAQLQPATTAQ